MFGKRHLVTQIGKRSYYVHPKTKETARGIKLEHPNKIEMDFEAKLDKLDPGNTSPEDLARIHEEFIELMTKELVLHIQDRRLITNRKIGDHIRDGCELINTLGGPERMDKFLEELVAKKLLHKEES